MFEKKLILILLFCFSMVKSQSGADEILGVWVATDNSVVVKVYQLNNEYKAKILWFDENLGSRKPMNARYDTENPNPSLRKRKIIGMEILEGLKFNPKQQSWENGKIYDASTGRHWDSSVNFAQDGTLKVRGYWKFRWIGKSMSFRRTNLANLKK